MVDADISVQVIADSYAQSQQAAPVDVRLESLKFLEIESKVANALHGWRPKCIGSRLERVSASGANAEQYRLREIIFRADWLERMVINNDV